MAAPSACLPDRRPPFSFAFVKPTPPPHPQPATLDELLANAEHYARFCMANSGSVSPALFFIGADGHGMCVPESLKDISAKDDFADLCRQACLAHAATACVMVIEAWAKFAKPGEELDTTEAPSEAIDRQEYVVLTGESRPELKQRFLPIIRSDNGRFFGFGFVLIGAPHAAFARGSSAASCTAHEETAGQTKRHLGFWQK